MYMLAETIYDIAELNTDIKEIQCNNYLISILRYAFCGEEPREIEGIAKTFFEIARKTIDTNNMKRENGKKGGRPKGANK